MRTRQRERERQTVSEHHSIATAIQINWKWWWQTFSIVYNLFFFSYFYVATPSSAPSSSFTSSSTWRSCHTIGLSEQFQHWTFVELWIWLFRGKHTITNEQWQQDLPLARARSKLDGLSAVRHNAMWPSKFANCTLCSSFFHSSSASLVPSLFIWFVFCCCCRCRRGALCRDCGRRVEWALRPQVRDGKYGFSDTLGRFCGNQFPSIISSSDKYLWLYFHSDESIEYIGFEGVYNFTARPPNAGKIIIITLKLMQSRSALTRENLFLLGGAWWLRVCSKENGMFHHHEQYGGGNDHTRWHRQRNKIGRCYRIDTIGLYMDDWSWARVAGKLIKCALLTHTHTHISLTSTRIAHTYWEVEFAVVIDWE